MARSPWEQRAVRMVRALTRSRGGPSGARQVIPYRGFGTNTEVFLSGRVLSNPPVPHVSADASWWRNMAVMFRHLESDEVAGARVRIRMDDEHVESITDSEGYFNARLNPPPLSSSRIWHPVDIDVIKPLHDDVREIRTSGLVLVPPPSVRFGVISDLDDTVIRTDATRLFSMLRRTLLENARTRLPFDGVAEFYGGLHLGDDGTEANPIFYVSSSPWNLYSVLAEFLDFQKIPLGPIMLRDWGLGERGLRFQHGEHKLGAIRQILDCYPDLPFILIGDSGQEDPEIYRDTVHDYRGRILAVYIRNVTTDPERARAIGELSEEVRSAGSELLLSDDTLAAARHAAERGWVGDLTIRRVAASLHSAGGRPGG